MQVQNVKSSTSMSWKGDDHIELVINIHPKAKIGISPRPLEYQNSKNYPKPCDNSECNADIQPQSYIIFIVFKTLFILTATLCLVTYALIWEWIPTKPWISSKH